MSAYGPVGRPAAAYRPAGVLRVVSRSGADFSQTHVTAADRTSLVTRYPGPLPTQGLTGPGPTAASSSGMSAGKIVLIAGIGVALIWVISRKKKG